MKLLNLLEVAFPSVAESQGDAKSHESDCWDQENYDAFADRALAFFRSGFGGAVAHRAALAEGRGCREKKGSDKKCDAKLHFGPSERMRRASGKKIIIRAKHTTSDAIVSHFMRETSNFMCMK